MQILIQYLLISLPEALIFLFFSLALMGIDWKPVWKQGPVALVTGAASTLR